MNNFDSEYYEDFNEEPFDMDDTLLTNMDNHQREIAEGAIKLTNLEDTITIDDTAILFNGRIDPSMFSMHINSDLQMDLTHFWRIFDQLEKKKNENNREMTIGDMLREIANV